MLEFDLVGVGGTQICTCRDFFLLPELVSESPDSEIDGDKRPCSKAFNKMPLGDNLFGLGGGIFTTGIFITSERLLRRLCPKNFSNTPSDQGIPTEWFMF